MICEQMNITPDPDKFPLELSDMPYQVQLAITIFQSLPDRFNSLGMEGSMYAGKDLASFGTLLEIYEITDSRDRQLILDVILHLDKKSIDRARAELQRRSKKK